MLRLFLINLTKIASLQVNYLGWKLKIESEDLEIQLLSWNPQRVQPLPVRRRVLTVRRALYTVHRTVLAVHFQRDAICTMYVVRCYSVYFILNFQDGYIK